MRKPLACLILVSACGNVAQTPPGADASPGVTYSLSEVDYDFGNHDIHSAAPLLHTITLTNTGVSTSFTVNSTGDFAIASTDCTATVASGGTCSIDIEFSPALVGTTQGTVDINSTEEVTVSGTGSAILQLDAIGFGGSIKDAGGNVLCPPGGPCQVEITDPDLMITADPVPGRCFDGWSNACPGGSCSMRCATQPGACMLDLNGMTYSQFGVPLTAFPDMVQGSTYKMTARYSSCF